jgi:hypothetical protein
MVEHQYVRIEHVEVGPDLLIEVVCSWIEQSGINLVHFRRVAVANVEESLAGLFSQVGVDSMSSHQADSGDLAVAGASAFNHAAVAGDEAIGFAIGMKGT